MSFEYSEQRSPFWIQGLEVGLSEEEMPRTLCLQLPVPQLPTRSFQKGKFSYL